MSKPKYYPNSVEDRAAAMDEYQSIANEVSAQVSSLQRKIRDLQKEEKTAYNEMLKYFPGAPSHKEMLRASAAFKSSER